MGKHAYIEKRFQRDSLQLLEKIDEITTSYMQQGFVLTLRQLYYQLVSRNIVPNTERSYKNVGSLLNDGRMAGYIDWDAIEDRTRAFIDRPHWSGGKSFMESVAPQFYMDMWEGQDYRPFVLVEKEALAGVLERVSRELDVPLLACRGYPSVTVIREFALTRIRPTISAKQKPLIIHLGDHDPSGIDMTRDIRERIANFIGGTVELRRIALNMDQITDLELPPNPAKMTDARFDSYQAMFGDESWELDAIEPNELVRMVREEVESVRDEDQWDERAEEIKEIREKLEEFAESFDD